jgi:hypothetical protein
MSSEKHVSPPERQKCFSDIQPPVLGADLQCFVLPVVSWLAFMTALFGFLKLTS